MIVRILLAIQNASHRRRLRQLLNQSDVLVDVISTTGDPWRHCLRQSGDLLIVDAGLIPQPRPEALHELRSLPDAPELVVLVDREDPTLRTRLLASGCLAVLNLEVETTLLGDALGALIARCRWPVDDDRHAPIGQFRASLNDFVSSSPAMQTFMGLVQRVVSSDTSLLILGETGVGKELLARAMHAESPRAEGPFVAVNCAALTETLLESELFGHEEGAFTGATRARRGWFELAHRGTVFLDEVCEMPPHLQVKLLRVLQSREVQRVGGESTIHIDVRVMAATNRDVLAEVAAGAFRRDLYYRLSVITLTIPPLRERMEDVPSLVTRYLEHFGGVNRQPNSISAEALAALSHYDWPGNVRELVNVVERALLICNSPEISLADLPTAISTSATTRLMPSLVASALVAAEDVPREWLEQSLPELREALVVNFEQRYLSALLRECRGKIGETARRAGIDQRSLYEKMRRYGLKKEDYR